MAFLAGLSVALYGSAILPGRVISSAGLLFTVPPWNGIAGCATPTGPVLSDPALMFEPWQIFARREACAGRLPLWNPHAFGGAPLLGNMQSALLSPFTLPTYLLPASRALGVGALLKSLTAGLGMYWFLGVVGLAAFPSLVGALAFGFGGFVSVWVCWPLGGVAVLLPVALGATERLRQTGRWREAGWLGLATSALILAGHPQTSFYVFLVAGIYALLSATGPGRWRFLGLFAAGMGIAGAVTAVQVLPFIEYLRQTSVWHYRRQDGILSVHGWRVFLTFFLPRYFGTAERATGWDSFYSRNVFELGHGVGVLPWLLLPFALSGVRRRWHVRFFAGLAVVSTAVAFRAPLIPWLVSYLPGFSALPNHRLTLFAGFGLAGLAGAGAQVLMEGSRRTRRRAAAWVAVVALALAALVALALIRDREAIRTGHAAGEMIRHAVCFAAALVVGTLAIRRAARSGMIGAGVLGGLLFAGLGQTVPFAASLVPVMPARCWFPPVPALEFMGRDADTFRVLLPLPNVGAAYRLSGPEGYDSMTPRRIERLLQPGRRMGPLGNEPLRLAQGGSQRMLDLFGVKYLVFPADRGEGCVYRGSDAAIRLNPQALPRVFAVSGARTCRDDEEAVALVVNGPLDLRRRVVLVAGESVPASPGARSPGRASIVSYEAGRAVVHADLAAAGCVVFLEAWDPGWRARVDGTEAELLRADYAFQAVRVPAGRHEIEFRYRPVGFPAAVVLSLLGLAALGWCFLPVPGRGRQPGD